MVLITIGFYIGLYLVIAFIFAKLFWKLKSNPNFETGINTKSDALGLGLIWPASLIWVLWNLFIFGWLKLMQYMESKL